VNQQRSNKVVPIRQNDFEDLHIKVPSGYRAIVTFIPKDTPVTTGGFGNNIIGTGSNEDSTEFYSLPFVQPSGADEGSSYHGREKEESINNGEKGKQMTKSFLSLKVVNYISISAIFIGIILVLFTGSFFAVASLLFGAFCFSFSMFAIRRISGLDIIDPNISALVMLGSLGLLITLFLTLL